ncbi:MAG: hypothetical protein RJA59_2302, partial [Pseudomonadota bacterium]
MSLEHVDVLLAALRTLPVVRDLDAHGSQADLVRLRCEKIQTHEPTEPAATLATREREAREAMVCQAAASVEASEVEDLQRWRMAGATPYAIVCDVLAPIER